MSANLSFDPHLLAMAATDLAGFVHAYGLDGDPVLGEQLLSAVPWAHATSPADATEVQRDLACIDLALCFFAIAGASEEEQAARIADLVHVLEGHDVDPARPLQRAYAGLCERLAALGLSLDRFRTTRLAFAKAMGARRGAAGDFEAGFAARLATSYLEPWLALWELLHGFVLCDTERAALAPAMSHARRWHVLDTSRTLAMQLASERRYDVDVAAQSLLDHARGELRAFAAAARQIRTRHRQPALLRVLATLEASVDGARRLSPA